MRKETRGMTWASLLALASLAGAAVAAPASKPAANPGAKPAAKAETFACEWGVRSSAYGFVDTTKLWTKGSKLRLEKKTGAGLRVMLLRNDKGVFQLNQATMDGHKWQKDWERGLPQQLNIIGGPQGDPQKFLKLVKAKRVSQERYNGRPAEIWAYSMGSGKQQQSFRVWIATSGGQPLKMETRIPNPRGGVNVVAVDYKVYRWGMDLDDSLFEVPRGARISDLSRGPSPQPASLKK
jgi:hypothetical protein